MKKITINIPDSKTVVEGIKRSFPSLYLLQQQETKKLNSLQEETNEAKEQLEKIKQLTRHYQSVYGGLAKLKALKGLPESIAQKQANGILIKEIARLQKITAKQQELLVGKSFSSPVLSDF
jgi:hypothetical protein